MKQAITPRQNLDFVTIKLCSFQVVSLPASASCRTKDWIMEGLLQTLELTVNEK